MTIILAFLMGAAGMLLLVNRRRIKRYWDKKYQAFVKKTITILSPYASKIVVKASLLEAQEKFNENPSKYPITDVTINVNHWHDNGRYSAFK